MSQGLLVGRGWGSNFYLSNIVIIFVFSDEWNRLTITCRYTCSNLCWWVQKTFLKMLGSPNWKWWVQNSSRGLQGSLTSIFVYIIAGVYSLAHEVQQRKVERDFTEFWYYMVNQLEKLKSAGSNDMPVKLQSLLKQGKNYQR